MGAISPFHLILILAVALLFIGPGKLPETGAAIGKAVRGFRDAVDGKLDAAGQAQLAPIPVRSDEAVSRIVDRR